MGLQAKPNDIAGIVIIDPRKCLGIKTPTQVFLGINPPVELMS